MTTYNYRDMTTTFISVVLAFLLTVEAGGMVWTSQKARLGREVSPKFPGGMPCEPV
jgi:hypothetical protein